MPRVLVVTDADRQRVARDLNEALLAARIERVVFERRLAELEADVARLGAENDALRAETGRDEP